MDTPHASDDDRRELLLSCRLGDLPDVQRFVARFSPAALDDAVDGNRNTALHMAAANGHTDVLAYLLPRVAPCLLAQPNLAGSTPLHWAALNRHLDAVQTLVQFPAGPGVDLIDIKNAVGCSPLGEAELAGWDEGARWFVQVMKLDKEQPAEADAEEADPSRAIEVEIQDADGQVARTTISPSR